MCKEGKGISPMQPGDALLFYNFHLPNFKESIRGVHGACGIGKEGKTKHILVKLVTDGNVRGVRRQQAEEAIAGQRPEEWRAGV